MSRVLLPLFILGIVAAGITYKRPVNVIDPPATTTSQTAQNTGFADGGTVADLSDTSTDPGVSHAYGPVFYSTGSINYYFYRGRYFFVRDHMRFFVDRLPPGGANNSRHPDYANRDRTGYANQARTDYSNQARPDYGHLSYSSDPRVTSGYPEQTTGARQPYYPAESRETQVAQPSFDTRRPTLPDTTSKMPERVPVTPTSRIQTVIVQ